MLRLLHLPKTAGSTLTRSFQHAFGKRVVRDYPNNGREFLTPFLRLEPDGRRTQESEVLDRRGMRRELLRNRTKLIASHGSYERLAWLAPAERTIVFFREPVQRVVSQYEHNSRVRLERGQDPMPHTLLEWARREEWRNVQARKTAGLDLGAAFVGFTERYAQSLAELNARFGLELEVRTGNVNPRKAVGALYQLDAATVAELEELNADDMALYRELL